MTQFDTKDIRQFQVTLVSKAPYKSQPAVLRLHLDVLLLCLSSLIDMFRCCYGDTTHKRGWGHRYINTQRAWSFVNLGDCIL